MVAKARHGHSTRGVKSPEYHAWQDAKARCSNPNIKSYPNYGGRGITMSDQWASNFEAFLADMGPRPSPKHTLERKDNDGNYEPENCKWATRSEQMDNRRTTTKVILDGVEVPLTAAVEKLGLKRRTVNGRLKKGWPLEAALSTTPFTKWNSPK